MRRGGPEGAAGLQGEMRGGSRAAGRAQGKTRSHLEGPG